MDYEIVFNSTAANITTESLNTELKQVLNMTNGTIGDSLVLGQVEGDHLFIVEGTQSQALKTF